MDGPGPDVKRPRHHYEPQRIASQLHHPPPPPSHAAPPAIAPSLANSGPILPAPSSYPPPSQQQQQPPPPPPPSSSSLPPPSQQQPPPPSPYNDVNHDSRSLPDPHNYLQQQQQQQHSGHSTPRDGRFQQTDLIYTRRSSAAGTPRSPDEYHPYPPTRSMSVATSADGQHYPSQYPADPGGHPGPYPPPDLHTNGNMHHGLPMHGSYESMHAVPPASHMDYSQSPVTPGPPPYGAMQFGNVMGPTGFRPKKGNRATQACDICRARKAKCDEGRPKCGFCTENDMTCNYQSVAPAKVDRANQQIMDQLSTQQDDIKTLKQEFGAFGGKLERIEQILLKSSGMLRLELSPIEDTETERKLSLTKLESPSAKATVDAPRIPTMQPSPGARDHKVLDSSPNGSFNTALTDSSGSDALASIAKQNAIHVEHHTAAQKLFRWPSIKTLLQKCRGLNFTESSEDYFMHYELNQGSLRLYGRGQGTDLSEENHSNTTSTGSPAPSHGSAPSDEYADASSPASSPEFLWGYGFNPTVGEPRLDIVAGGLNSDNSLKLDPKTISNHLQSYLDNIHVLHPILDEHALVKTVEKFKRRYNPSPDQSHKAGFLSHPSGANLDATRDGSAVFNKTGKRKHSDGLPHPSGPETGSGQSIRTPKALLERSPTTAMVLLVMALGKICEHRGPLPGPVKDGPKDGSNSTLMPYSDSPPLHSVQMKPSQSSSSHSTSASSPGSTVRQGHFSPRPGSELPTHTRNLDVMPGLAYYAQATDILGNIIASHDISFVQCCLLAGLYAGQLANSIESLHWIQIAARACQILVRDPSVPRIGGVRQNLIKVAYFSALQLESDIRAEIDMPSSGIDQFKDPPEMPSGYVAVDSAELGPQAFTKGQIMQFYSFQLHIRKILNDVQKEMYPESKDLTQTTRSTSMRNALDQNLNDWKQTLLSDLQWVDSDQPSRFINHARLRGKFYGAQYIIHRPFLHYALELDADGRLDQNMAPKPGEMAPPKITADPYLEEILTSARTTVKAAILSTIAFDGIIEIRRLIVTNIVGTAHAQFGNMLVLSAVYKSKHLRELINLPFSHETPKQIMRRLFARTIGMLKDLTAISRTLGHDRFILSCLKDVVFEGEDDDVL